MGCLLIVPLTGVVLALGVGFGALTAIFMGMATGLVTLMAGLIGFWLVLI